jgi:hypothetical protein
MNRADPVDLREHYRRLVERIYREGYTPPEGSAALGREPPDGPPLPRLRRPLVRTRVRRPRERLPEVLREGGGAMSAKREMCLCAKPCDRGWADAPIPGEERCEMCGRLARPRLRALERRLPSVRALRGSRVPGPGPERPRPVVRWNVRPGDGADLPEQGGGAMKSSSRRDDDRDFLGTRTSTRSLRVRTETPLRRPLR